MSDIYGGLLSTKAVATSARSDSNLFVRVGANGNSEITGDLIIGGDLEVAGNTTIDGTLAAGNTTITGNATITGTLTVSGDAVIPQPMKSTSAKTNGSLITFTNTAEVLSNSSVVASRTGYYQFMAQLQTVSIGSFDAGTDAMTFYADISGGSLSPILGSIKDITNVMASGFETTFSGYAYATAGETIRLIHVDTGTFTITSGSVYVLWQYMGDGAGLA